MVNKMERVDENVEVNKMFPKMKMWCLITDGEQNGKSRSVFAEAEWQETLIKVISAL